MEVALIHNTEIQTIQQPAIHLTFTDVGIQGMPGSKGERGNSIEYVWQGTRLGIKTEEESDYVFTDLKGNSLTFDNLTEQQKQELRGDVGNTSTNYTNLFNSVLLS